MSVPRPKGRKSSGGKTRGGARVRRPKQAQPIWEQPLRRRQWLRAIAYAIGAFVMLAHLYTFETPATLRNMFELSVRDVIYHGGMFAAFTIAFRLSLEDVQENAGAMLRPADATALLVCCGWGALCESLQLLLFPRREFHLSELALNTGVPVIVIALISLATRRQ